MDALKTIAAGSVKDTTPQFGIGDTVRVKVLEVDRMGKISLSLKDAE